MSIRSIIVGCFFLLGLAVGWIANGWRLNGTIDKINADHTKELLHAEKVARFKERTLQKRHDVIVAEYEKEKQNANSQIVRLKHRIASGDVRLSVRANTVSRSARAGTTETRCELDSKTADELIDIVYTGDTAIRELNQCIDQYNAVKTALNGV